MWLRTMLFSYTLVFMGSCSQVSLGGTSISHTRAGEILTEISRVAKTEGYSCESTLLNQSVHMGILDRYDVDEDDWLQYLSTDVGKQSMKSFISNCLWSEHYTGQSKAKKKKKSKQ